MSGIRQRRLLSSFSSLSCHLVQKSFVEPHQLPPSRKLALCFRLLILPAQLSTSSFVPRPLTATCTAPAAAILLASSFFMVLAVSAAKENKVGASTMWIVLTALLGASFVGFQIYEFNHFYHEGMTLQGNLFGSTFYTLTGLHGTHVAVGVLWLCLQAFWMTRGWIRGDEGNAVEVAGLYWHFVDIVWIVIFTLIYLLEYVR